MYGLPKDKDLSFLLSAGKVDEVCIGLSSVIIKWPNAASISVEGEFVFNRNDGQSIRVKRGEYPLTVGCLSHLVYSTIVGYEIQDKGTLMLNFSNGDQLSLLDDSSKYESYEISTNQGPIIV
jgi:hypothetical protein